MSQHTRCPTMPPRAGPLGTPEDHPYPQRTPRPQQDPGRHTPYLSGLLPRRTPVYMSLQTSPSLPTGHMRERSQLYCIFKFCVLCIYECHDSIKAKLHNYSYNYNLLVCTSLKLHATPFSQLSSYFSSLVSISLLLCHF